MITLEEIREQIAACEAEREMAKRNIDRSEAAVAVLRHFEQIAVSRMAEEAAAKLKTESTEAPPDIGGEP